MIKIKLLNNIKTLSIICNQYGDTGKGKFSDYFSSWAHVIARGTGGDNAGHTVVVDGKQKIFHLLPAGITYDGDGKVNILGNGMVINLEVLCQELDELEKDGFTYNNLMISKDAHVVMPYHIGSDFRDVSQKEGGIGTTGRGIGPCYTDKIARRGVRIFDLLNKDTLVKKIKEASEFYSQQSINVEDIVYRLTKYTDRIRPFIKDTIFEMHEFIKQNKKILVEGAQGLLLSIEYGTYPYVTSSDSSINGTACGVGISAKSIDLVLGIIKFPYMSRVGAGLFPTELGGGLSEDYCANQKHTKEYELSKYGIPYKEEGEKLIYDHKDSRIFGLIGSIEPFSKGVGIRLAGGEYGATTGRPRRIGWTDALAAKYAIKINSPIKLILTKADVLCGAREFNVCYYYEKGVRQIVDFDKDNLRNIKPIYKRYDGYSDISEERNYEKLPLSLRNAINDFVHFTDCEVVIVSVGQEKDQTIIV